MLRTWLIMGWMTVSVAVSAAADPVPPPTPQQLIENLQREFSQKIADLQSEISALKAQAARMEANQTVLADSWHMRTQIESLQSEVARLREQLQANERGGSASTANRLPMSPGTRRESLRPDPNLRDELRPTTGALRLINQLTTIQEVRVNGVSYFLMPGEQIDVTVPAGTFTYQVVGIDPLPRTRSMVAGRVFTANIHP
ncbi:MAG: hypothetical protein N2039_07580 [Gemmataceae bacterium]|nr:hypothetical protein [Gemmataceae bacterium]